MYDGSSIGGGGRFGSDIHPGPETVNDHKGEASRNRLFGHNDNSVGGTETENRGRIVNIEDKNKDKSIIKD